jgi:hypothetical protein
MYAVRHPRAEVGARAAVLEPLIREAIVSRRGTVSRASFDAVLGEYQEAWARDVEATIPQALGWLSPLRSSVSIAGFDPSEHKLFMSSGDQIMDPKLLLHLDLSADDWDPDTLAADRDQLASRSSDLALLLADYISERTRERRGWTAQPAERLGIQVFGPELAARRFEDANQSTYPWLIGDAISGRVRAAMKRESPLADRLEDELLGGRISIDSDGAFGFKPRDAANSLSIREVSSSVKSIAPLSIELRGRSPAAVIIIDEPEMSLHPDLQRKFVRWLGGALREGHRFVIATHSDYIIRELSHLMMLHNASPALAAVATQRGYSVEEAIDPASVQVLRLGEGTATPVEVSRYGFLVKTIEDELRESSMTTQSFLTALDDDE